MRPSTLFALLAFAPALALAEPPCDGLDYATVPPSNTYVAQGGVVEVCLPPNDQPMDAVFRAADGSEVLRVPGLAPLSFHRVTLPPDLPDQPLTLVPVESATALEGPAYSRPFQVPPGHMVVPN